MLPWAHDPAPPLNALRAFEVAARNGSHVAAGAELGVPAAAICPHIRTLETHLGRKVFRRLNNRILLTDAGMAFRDATTGPLQAISEASEELIHGRGRGRLVISAVPSLAEKWLLPRLAAHAAAVPDFRFDLRLDPDPVDLGRQGIDLRLGHDPAHYPDCQTLDLGTDAVRPICAPFRLAARPQAHAVVGTLIHTARGIGLGLASDLARLVPGRGTPVEGGFQVGSSGLAIDLALAGCGIALSEIALPLGHPCCLAWPQAGRRHLQGLVASLTKKTRARLGFFRRFQARTFRKTWGKPQGAPRHERLRQP